MKKSELTAFIKEEILGTLNESPSTEEIRMAKQIVARFMKYRQVGQDEAIRDLKNALDALKPSMEEATIETSPEDLAKVKQTADKDDVIKVTEEAGLSEENIGLADLEEMGYDAGEQAFEKVKGMFKNRPDFQSYKKGYMQGFIDSAGSYGLSETVTEEEEDAPAGDAEIEKKATKQDQIIKNYQNLQKELKKHLKAYKESKSEEEKQSHLKDMKKISQSAEYLDAKAKYEKLKKIK